MKRDILNELNDWRVHPLRKPLILRGARQVGKSWLVREFGKLFDSYVEVNLEKEKGARELFSGDINIQKLLERLSLYSGKGIRPGETLLFLDEIQDCAEAISYLRYFKEEMPGLHVIAAGSLLDFALEKIGLPVGRVQFLYLYPLSFGEYLEAIGRDDLRGHIRAGGADTVVHGHLLDALKNYMWLGGMPAVDQAWLDYKDAKGCQEVQDEILNAYRQDFEKYARRHQIGHVSRVFESIPLQIGRKFKLSHVDENMRTPVVKEALGLLVKAHIAMLAHHTSGQGLPLGAMKDEKKFKAFFFDVGLAQRLMGLDLKRWIVQPLRAVNVGPIAEQFVAQELIAHASPKARAELYYWHREARASSAEVDLLWAKDDMIVPIEIKSGSRGSLKSMHLFLESHPASKYGVKLSELPYSMHGKIREIPLYGIEAFIRFPAENRGRKIAV